MPPETSEKRINVVPPEGGPARSIPESLLDQALIEGFKVETREDRLGQITEAAREEDFGGIGGGIGAGLAGVARGATFGLSDVIRRVGGADPVEMREQKAAHPTISTVTEVAGAVLPTIATGGTGALGSVARATPAGAASKLALGVTGRVAGQAPSTARYIAGTAAGGAVEGGLQNLGSYVSDVALQNKKLSAEGALGALGSGGVFGGLAGGAFGGIERGTIAARRLFPKSEAGERAVEAAEKEFVAQAEDVVRSGDELARTAQQRLDDIALRRAELNLEKLKLKAQNDPAAKERLAEIRVEQARLVAARRAAKGEIDAERAARSASSPSEVAPVAPQADGIVPTGDEVGGVVDAIAPPPAATPVSTQDAAAGVVPSLAGSDDLLTRLSATKGLLDEGVPFTDIGAAANAESVIDDAIRQADDQAARLQDKLDRFKQGKPMADDFIAKYGKGAKSKYSATGGGGTRGGGAGPVRTDRTRLLADEEIEASINDRVFAGIGAERNAQRAEMPRGFDGGPLGPDAPVRRGLPRDGEAFDENVIYVAKAGDLRRAGLRAGDDSGFAQNRVDSVRKAWSENKRLDPIKAGFEENGDLVIIDGRHRLAAAGDDDEIAVRLYPFSDEPGQAFGRSGATQGYRSAADSMPSPKTSMAGAELDAAYEDAIERAAMAPNRAAQERALREAADLEDQIFDTVAARGGRDAADVEKIRTKRGDLGQDSYTVAMRRAEKRAMAEEGRPMSDKARAERDDLEAYDRGLREQQFAGGKTAGEVAAELRKPLADRILGTAPPKVEPSGMGKFLDDADEAIRVVGEMEKATAELAQELGDATPPKAKALADGYWKAVDDQQRKMVEKVAMSADDAAKAGSLMSLPKPPAVPTSEARRLGKGVADAAAVLDTIQTFGDIPGMPNPRDIPVIGPVLSMYLKVRAGRMALRRIGGRIPATSEAKIAARSAELRDRAAEVVDRILLGTAKTAKIVRRPAVAAGTKLMDSLSRSLYPQDERKEKPKTPNDAVQARVRELTAAATDPDGVRRAIRSAINVADPDLSREIEDATLRKLDYLHKNAPKMPTPQLLGSRPWAPNRVEIEKFARRIRATEDPVSVLDDLEAGTLTQEAAEAMRVVYPALFSEVQMRLIDRAAELEVSVPYKRRLTLSALFDVPLDDSLQPARLLQLQQIYTSGGASPDAAGAAPGGPQPPAPSVAAPVRISNLYDDTRRSRR